MNVWVRCVFKILMVVMLIGALSADAQTPPQCSVGLRGRPIIGDGTVLSDRSTPLRGSRWSLDNLGVLPSLQTLTNTRTRGFNTLHVYAENAGANASAGQPPGYHLAELDQLVEWTDQLGIYLVITVGGGFAALEAPDPELSRRIAWALDFWDLYASRYKDCAHVLYEIQNEPDTPSFSDTKRQMEADAYHLIRQAAPDTPILLFSYNWLHGGRQILADICAVEAKVCLLDGNPPSVCDALKPIEGPKIQIPLECWTSPQIDWARSALAFHGYADVSFISAALDFVTRPDRVPNFPGYPAMETELSTLDPADDLEPDLIELYETTRTSWLAFIRLDAAASRHENVINSEGFVWATDYGTWPGFSNPPFGAVLSLVAQENQQTVRVDVSDPARPLVADGQGSAGAKNFTLLPAGLGRVALLSSATGLYIEAIDDTLVATSPVPYAFDWIDRPDGNITLQATGSWNYVSPDLSGSITSPPLRANELRGGFVQQSFAVAPPEVDCGGAFQQAEDGVLQGPFVVKSEGSVTFIEVPDGTFSGAQAPDDSKKASYCFQVSNPGTYRFKARVRAANQGDDSFWIRVDGQPTTPYLWVPRPLGGWVDDFVGDFNGIDPLEFTLSAGNHTLDVLLREDGTQLDSITLESVAVSQPFQAAKVTADEVNRSITLSGFSNAIVVMGPPSYNGGHASVMRITSASSSSFQYQLEEWDYLDGFHAIESVGYLALPSGTSALGSLPAESGSRLVSTGWVTVTFQQPFSQVPVVLPQVASIVDPSAVTVRVRNVTTSGFEMQLQEEQGADGVHASETVHWIAIAPGQTTVNGRKVVVVRSGNQFNHNFQFLGFGTSLSNPSFVAAMQTRNGSDTAALRYQNLSASGVEFKVEEEQSFDTETDHVNEVIGLVALEP